MARTSRKEIYAGAEHLGNESPVQFGEIPEGDSEIERVVAVDDQSAKFEQFMNEPVTVVVQSTSDETEGDYVQVGVNGVTQYFRRDVAQTVKRKFVARLARAKRTDYRQSLDFSLGEKMNMMSRHHSLKYPFTVIEDKNPIGSAWLKSLLSQTQ